MQFQLADKQKKWAAEYAAQVGPPRMGREGGPGEELCTLRAAVFFIQS